MEEFDDALEKELEKYTDYGTADKKQPGEDTAEDTRQAEKPEPASPQEEPDEDRLAARQEEEMKARVEEARAQQQEQLKKMPGYEEMQRQRQAFMDSTDIAATIEKVKASVNEESDKVFYAWLMSRFPKIFEVAKAELEQEQRQKQREQEQTEEE